MAGVISLIWQAAPCLIGSFAETEAVLKTTAVPIPYDSTCGGEGGGDHPNNATGWGEIDALAAVDLATGLCGPSGSLEGYVTGTGGEPIVGALVEIGGRSGLSDAAGHYRVLHVPEGTHGAVVSHYRYFPEVFDDVVIAEDETTPLDAQLSPRPSAPLSGTVRDGSGHGWPLYARLDVIAPMGEMERVYTDPMTGSYSTGLLTGVEYTVIVTAHLAGYAQKIAVVTIGSETVRDFVLESPNCDAPGYAPQYLVAYFEDFETDDGGFTTSGVTSFAWGQPTSGPGAAYSGVNAWGTNLAGDYGNNENGSVVSPVIDLSAYSSELTLSWWQYLNTERSWDSAYVDVSNDGGSTWQAIYGPVSGGIDTVWAERTHVLDAGYTSGEFRVRFRMTTDGSVTYPGFFIDDVGIMAIEPDCLKTAGGLVFGQVRDLNDGRGVVGAVVEDGHGTLAETFENADDPSLPVGVYFLFAPPGEGTLSATAPGYGVSTQGATVPEGGVVRRDFDLGTGRLQLTGGPIYDRLHADRMDATHHLMLENTGTATVHYEIGLRRGHASSSAPHGAPFDLTRLAEPVATGAAAQALTAQYLDALEAPARHVTAEDALIINEFATGHVLSWAAAVDRHSGMVWVGETMNTVGNTSDDFLEIFSPDGVSHGTVPSDLGGSFVAGGCYDETQDLLWFVNVGSDNCIHAVDPRHEAFTGEMICPGWHTNQRGLAHDPNTDTFYAGTWNDRTITHFTRDGTILDNVFVDLGISGLAYNQVSGHLYVAESKANNVGGSLHVMDPHDEYAILRSYNFPGKQDFFQAGLGIDCDGSAWIVDQKENKAYQVDVGEPPVCGLDWAEAAPEAGALAPGESVSLIVRLYADEVDFGHHEGRLAIWNDTPYGTAAVDLTMDYVDNHTVTITTEGGGTTSPAGEVTVLGLDDLAIRIVPEPGHHAHEVYLDGEYQGRRLEELVIERVERAHAVHVVFGYTCALDTDCVNPHNDCLGICHDEICLFDIFKSPGDACGDQTATRCTAPETCNGFGVCLTNHAPSGTSCDADGDGCTVGDSCSAGVCLAGARADCSHENDPCNTGVCVSTGSDSYVCEKDSAPHEGRACDADGDGCTVGDSCSAGVCVAGAAPDCSALDDACNVGVCLSTGPNSYVCQRDPAPLEGELCDADGDGCTVGDSCSAGVCLAGARADCSHESDQCNAGVCVSTGSDSYVCKKDPSPYEDRRCNADDNGCTVGDSCSAGVCVAGAAPDCSALDDACNVGVCLSTGPNSYVCQRDPAPLEGELCDADGDGCTVDDSCRAGVCLAGDPPDCSDEDDPCNTGICVSTGSDSYVCEKDPTPHEGDLCDADGDGCTVDDTCHEGVCLAGARADCSHESDPCNVGVCVSTGSDSYVCEKDPTPHEGELCDADGDGCTVDDICHEGVCVAGAAPDCSALDDACNVGVCVTTGPNSYICQKDPAPLEGELCDADGDGCTVDDACRDGVCVAGALADCSGEDDQCNTGVCVSTGSDSYVCQKNPTPHEGDRCDDGDSCTFEDRCRPDGTCVGSPYTCDDPDRCETAEGAVCLGDGTCSYPATPGVECDDGDPCTVAECDGHECLPIREVDNCCTDLLECHVPFEMCDLDHNLCVTVMCSPCVQHGDCGAEGNLCVMGPHGDYCAVACAPDAEEACPEGTACRELDGGSFQCLPLLGDCFCEPREELVCLEGTLVWRSSCGDHGDVVAYCGERGCSAGACCPEGTTEIDGDCVVVDDPFAPKPDAGEHDPDRPGARDAGGEMDAIRIDSEGPVDGLEPDDEGATGGGGGCAVGATGGGQGSTAAWSLVMALLTALAALRFGAPRMRGARPGADV